MSKLSNIQTVCDNCQYAPALDDLAVDRIKALTLELIGEDHKQVPPHQASNDDGEAHDRFFRDGGYNFAKREIRRKVEEL